MDRNSGRPRQVAAWILLLTLLGVSIAPALAAGHVSVVVPYDPALGQLPEGVAVDKAGNIYVSLAPISVIQRITPDGTASDFASLPLPTSEGIGVIGLAVDARGRLFAALASGDPATQGVYRISRDGSSERIPGTEAITFPNALAFDKRGNLYVTDTIFGAVWRIPRGGSAELWIQDDTLVGFILPDPSAPPFPIGANGIAYWKKALYVANTSEAQIVRIPIEKDGSAGTPEVLVKDAAELTPLDGIAFDVHGDLYALVIAQSKLVRIDLDTGEITTLATADDGLDFPASLAFGTGRGDRKSVFVTNFAIGPPGGTGPALLRVEVGVPGLPLP